MTRRVTASLDRFEDDVAVFEDRESGETLRVPRAELPPEFAPGDLARLEVTTGARFLEPLLDESAALRERLQAKRDRLRARRED